MGDTLPNEVLQQTVEKAPEKTPENLMPTGQMQFSILETAAILGMSDKSVRRLCGLAKSSNGERRQLMKVNRALRKAFIARAEIEKFIKL